MDFSNFLLDLLALGAIVSAILVITSKNPVISVLFLISVFVYSACYLLVLGVGFVGLSYLIIYVGAITVLFLFVIMMINIKLVDLLDVGTEYTQNLPLGLIITGLFFYEMLTITPINLNFDTIASLPFWILNEINSLLLIENNSDYVIIDFLNQAKISILPSIENLSDLSLYSFLQIEMLGQTLYTYHFILLIIMGIILFLAMFGPIILSLK